MCLIAFLVLVAAVVTVGLSLAFLPWWGSTLVIGGMLLAFLLSLKWIAKKVFMRLALIPFEMKSRALRGAGAEVHSVGPAEAPRRDPARPMPEEGAADEGEEKPAEPVRDYYLIEATITPDARLQGKFRHWDIDDLMLVPFEMKVRMSAEDDLDDETCRVESVRVMVGGVYETPEQSKFHGPHRLELLVGVKHGCRRVKFRYYFEAFGDDTLF